jgi:hypothetical protein
MIARGLIFAAALLASAGAALAQAPVERGKYLVNTIMTCQNCHTPKGERGAPVFERDLSSGLSWDEPPFKVTASNITQDKETGIGTGATPTSRRRCRRASGRTACGSPRSCRRTSTRSSRPATSMRSSPISSTVKPVKQETPTPIYRIALPRHIPPGAEKPFSDADMATR